MLTDHNSNKYVYGEIYVEFDVTELIKNNMSNIFKYLVYFIVLHSGIGFSVTAQNDKPGILENYRKHCDFLLQEGGKWKVANKTGQQPASGAILCFVS